MNAGTRWRTAAARCALVALAVACASCRMQGAGPRVLREAFPSALEVQRVMPAGTWAGVRGVYRIRGPSGVLGYGVEEQVVSRSGPFTILVIIGPELRVRRALVLSYPSERGREVRSPGFARQFEGKGLGDAIGVGRDIDAVTGATLSSRAMADGVRGALRVVQRQFAQGRQPAPQPLP